MKAACRGAKDACARAVGLIEHAVLLGAPVSKSAERFKMARAAVVGRFVNAYSIADWLLALCCRCAATDGAAPLPRPCCPSALASSYPRCHCARKPRRTKISQSAFKQAAGNGAVGCAGVEDVDLSALVHKHSDWCRRMPAIASILDLD